MRRIRRRRKSDACLEATEKFSIVRHFLIASELRRHGKPHFSRPQTVALAMTMCRNSDELAVKISTKFSSDCFIIISSLSDYFILIPEFCDCFIINVVIS